MWTGDMHNGYPTQWALNPSAYQNMPNESVDWATLAQQWIKMKDTYPVGQVPPAPPPPSIKGEVPTTGSDEAILAANASSNSQDGMQWGSWQQWDWNSNSGYNSAPATFDYNHGATSAVPVADNYDQGYWSGSQAQAPHSRGGRSSEWRGAEGGRSQSARRQPVPRPEEVVEFQPDSIAMIDAAKRKQLPAWIREGLEKMEREKQKKQERDRQLKEREEDMLRRKLEEEEALASGIPVKSKFETDSEESGKEDELLPQEEDQNKKMRRSRFDTGPMSPAPQPAAKVHSPPPTPLPLPVKRKTREEIMQDVMQQVKYMLTDILMTVTNEEMQKISEESLADFRAKAPVTQLRKTPALTSLTGKLGLGIYDSDSDESSEDSEPEPDKTNGIDSDEVIRERLIRKRQEFARIERDIENEVEQQEERERERERERLEREAEEEKELETAAQVQQKLSSPGFRLDVKTEEPKITFEPRVEPETESYTPERLQSYKTEKSGSEGHSEESDKSSSTSDSSSSSSSGSKYRKAKLSKSKKEKRHSERKRKRSLSRGSERRRTSHGSGSRRHRSRSRSRSREYRRKRSRSRESHHSHSRSYSHPHSHKRRYRSRSYSRSHSPDYRSHYSRGKKSSHRSRD